MSAPTAEKDRTQNESGGEDYSSSVEEAQPVTRGDSNPRRGSRRPRQQRQQRQSNQLEQVGGVTDGVNDTANKAADGVTNTMGSVANTALENQGKEGGGDQSDTLKLRLDLNLDIEIQLKARIHGDLELALLTG